MRLLLLIALPLLCIIGFDACFIGDDNYNNRFLHSRDEKVTKTFKNNRQLELLPERNEETEMDKDYLSFEEETITGKIIQKPAYNKAGKAMNLMDFFLKQNDEELLLLKFSEPSLSAEINQYINKTVSLKGIRYNGSWDSNDPAVQSRVGDYFDVLNIVPTATFNLNSIPFYSTAKTYPYFAPDRRQSTIYRKMNELEIGFTKDEVIKHFGYPDEVQETYTPIKKTGLSATGFSFPYLLQQKQLKGSFKDKDERYIKIHFNTAGELSWAFAVGIEEFNKIEKTKAIKQEESVRLILKKGDDFPEENYQTLAYNFQLVLDYGGNFQYDENDKSVVIIAPVKQKKIVEIARQNDYVEISAVKDEEANAALITDVFSDKNGTSWVLQSVKPYTTKANEVYLHIRNEESNAIEEVIGFGVNEKGNILYNCTQDLERYMENAETYNGILSIVGDKCFLKYSDKNTIQISKFSAKNVLQAYLNRKVNLRAVKMFGVNRANNQEGYFLDVISVQ